jgi:hypothetical protein
MKQLFTFPHVETKTGYKFHVVNLFSLQVFQLGCHLPEACEGKTQILYDRMFSDNVISLPRFVTFQ